MPERDYQGLLDSAFEKLQAEGVELDHARRWQVESLTHLEKVMVILNDLYCEATRGGFDYWLQRRYCARGRVELQRVTAAIVEAGYGRDPVAAEVILAMCAAVDEAPPGFDPSYGEEHTEAEGEAYQAICDRLRFIDAAYYLNSGRMLRFNEAVVDSWDEAQDPFALPDARSAPRPRRRIAPVAPEGDGPVRYPSIQVGLTSAGEGCALRAPSIDAYDLYQTAALALYVGGAPVDDVAAFVAACEAVRDDTEQVLDRCVAMLDVDGSLAQTGRPADVGELLPSVTWTPTYMLKQVADSVRRREAGGALITAPDLDSLDGGPKAQGWPVRRLTLGEGALPLRDQAGEPDRQTPTFLLLEGAWPEGEMEQARAFGSELSQLASLHGALILIDAPEPVRQACGFMSSMFGVEHVNLHDDPWGFG